MSQQQLLVSLKKYLINKKYKIIATEQYIIAEGEIPICLVAHLDTVGPKPPTNIYYDFEQHVMWSPQLLGADDRSGVYAIIQIIESGYCPHIIFTTDEERGAVGASAIATQNPKCPLENLRAIFQLDRRGSNDCVFYDCDNPEFTKYVESFGFEKAHGSFSDISVLAPTWGVAAANLSCGYYNEHEYTEILKTKELEATIEKVKNILDDVENIKPFEYIEAKINFNWTHPYYNKCLFCNKKITENTSVTITENHYSFKICHDCYSSYYGLNDKMIY